MLGFLKGICSDIRSVFDYDMFNTAECEINSHEINIYPTDITLTEIVVQTFEPDNSPQYDIITSETFGRINIPDPYDLTKIIQPEHLIYENAKPISPQYTHNDVLEYVNQLSDKYIK